jgi:hypothetical protein
MSKKKCIPDVAECPVGRFFINLEKIFGATSDISSHLGRSQLEMLKAIRAFLDGRIDTLEKKKAGRRNKKMTKIKVD